MAEHELKTWRSVFGDVLDGSKTFELRKDDRGFAVGDTLVLREWDMHEERYTGRQCERRVTYILRGKGDGHADRGSGFGLPSGMVIMSLESSTPMPSAARFRVQEADGEFQARGPWRKTREEAKADFPEPRALPSSSSAARAAYLAYETAWRRVHPEDFAWPNEPPDPWERLTDLEKGAWVAAVDAAGNRSIDWESLLRALVDAIDTTAFSTMAPTHVAVRLLNARTAIESATPFTRPAEQCPDWPGHPHDWEAGGGCTRCDARRDGVALAKGISK